MGPLKWVTKVRDTPWMSMKRSTLPLDNILVCCLNCGVELSPYTAHGSSCDTASGFKAGTMVLPTFSCMLMISVKLFMWSCLHVAHSHLDLMYLFQRRSSSWVPNLALKRSLLRFQASGLAHQSCKLQCKAFSVSLCGWGATSQQSVVIKAGSDCCKLKRHRREEETKIEKRRWAWMLQ